jgi:hypothetical protein
VKQVLFSPVKPSLLSDGWLRDVIDRSVLEKKVGVGVDAILTRPWDWGYASERHCDILLMLVIDLNQGWEFI